MIPPPKASKRTRDPKQAEIEARMVAAFKKIPGATIASIGKKLTSLAYAAWHEGLITDDELLLLGGKLRKKARRGK